MKENEKSDVLTKILEDRTPDKDAFGGHERVAKAIYELIEDEKEGGKAIALSGGFGSGKSTVIEFLKQIFTNKEKEKQSAYKTGIFVFDAWEHQGNPLRRAFLEKYIDFLRDEIEWSGKNEWKEELELITKSREEIETTSGPKVTTLGGWFALSLLLLPLGLASVRFGLVDPPIDWLIYAGFGLLFFPTVILIGIYICWRPFLLKHWTVIKEEYNLKDFKFWSERLFNYIGYFLYHHRPPHHNESIFNFVIKKSTEEIETTSLKSPDPTTIEFQKLFGKISKRVLSIKKRRLIIVIDNIDRLTTESSINAWTTLQTFFENDYRNSEWKKEFWLIAPFDLQELKNLWSGLDHLKDSETNDIDSKDKTSEYVQAFIDKTFQILFRVPQPVLSDWKEFFIQQLGEAFPIINKSTPGIFNQIATLYQLKGIEGNEAPTPRNIKQFINRVSALYRIWHNEDIKLSTLAYYELIAEEENLVEKLKENDLVDSTSGFVIDEKELNRKLAAIHFNCKVDKAYQVLYGNEIGIALQEGTASDLVDYFETDGFLDVLESEFLDRIGQGIPLVLANSALCINEIEDKSNHKLHSYFNKLSDSFEQIGSIKPFSKNIGNGIAAVWEKTGFKPDWVSSILEKISLHELDEKEYSVEDWYLAIEPLLESLFEQSALYILKDSLKLPNTAEDYIHILTLISDADKDFKEEIVKHFNPNIGNDKVVEVYSNLIQSEEKLPLQGLGETFYLHAFTVEKNNDDWDWSRLTDQIRNLIKINGSNRSDQIEAALKMMLVLRFKYKDENALSLSKDPNFLNGILFMINNQNEAKVSKLLIFCTILFNPDNQKATNDNNVNKGHSIISSLLSQPTDDEYISDYFLNYLIDFRLIEDFMKIQDGNDNLNLLSEFIIQEIFDSEDALELINSSVFFTHFDDFYQPIGEKKLLDHIEVLYNREHNLVENITANFDSVPNNYKEHYYFFKECPEDLRESYFEYLAKGFRDLEDETWLNHIINESELIHLVIYIQGEDFDLGLPVKIKDVLEVHYKQIYVGEIEPPSEVLITKWDLLLDTLDEDIKSTFLKNIKFYLESNTDGKVSNIGFLYDSILISEGVYLSETGRFISNVFTRVLKSNDETELNWLKELISKQPEILDQDKSATNAFIAEVKYLEFEDYSEKASKIVKEIAKILKVDIGENNKDE